MNPDTPLFRKPTAAELGILRVLWLHGPCDAKQAFKHLLADKPDTNYANVLRQLQIMHGKGLLSRDETGRPHIYTPLQTREAVQSHLLKDVIHKLFAGSGKALVLAVLRGHVTREERAEIRHLLHGEAA